MPAVRALVLAFAIFVAAFALHVVGGATDQGWLFTIAVGLIYLTAAGYPAIALAVLHYGGPDHQPSRLVLGVGSLIALILTTSALRAGNNRTFAWWQPLLSVALVACTTGILLLAGRYTRSRRGAHPAPAG